MIQLKNYNHKININLWYEINNKLYCCGTQQFKRDGQTKSGAHADQGQQFITFQKYFKQRSGHINVVLQSKDQDELSRTIKFQKQWNLQTTLKSQSQYNTSVFQKTRNQIYKESKIGYKLTFKYLQNCQINQEKKAKEKEQNQTRRSESRGENVGDQIQIPYLRENRNPVVPMEQMFSRGMDIESQNQEIQDKSGSLIDIEEEQHKDQSIIQPRGDEIFQSGIIQKRKCETYESKTSTYGKTENIYIIQSLKTLPDSYRYLIKPTKQYLKNQNINLSSSRKTKTTKIFQNRKRQKCKQDQKQSFTIIVINISSHFNQIISIIE